MAEQTETQWHAVYADVPEHNAEPVALFRNPQDAMEFRRMNAGTGAVIVQTDSLDANRDVRDLFASRRGEDAGAATGAEAADEVRQADVRSRAQLQAEDQQALEDAKAEAAAEAEAAPPAEPEPESQPDTATPPEPQAETPPPAEPKPEQPDKAA